MAKVDAAGVDFVAGVGDQVDVTGNGDEQEYRHFFAPPELRSIPWAPAVGNHDRHYPFQYHYNLPNEQKFEKLQSAEYGNAANEQYAVVEAAGNYYYLYNNALFVVLNTSAYPTNANAAKPIIERFKATIAAAKAANTGKYDWLFVQHHKSTASVADHIADLDIQYYVEAGFEELMTEQGVDFVLAGHDHVYARSYPMTGKKGGTPSVPDTARGGDTISHPNGTIYVTATTGSGLKYYDLYNQSGNLYVKNNENYPYLVDGEKGSVAYAGANINNSNNASAPPPAITDSALWTKETGLLPLSNTECLQAKIPQYTIVDVAGNTVTFNTYNTYGDTINSIDSFTVTK
jgi:3',5'-cyclic AMP phosphodiesterase CpdA